MKLISFVVGLGVLMMAGCATVKLQAPEEPMKIDITMRLDVYQHVQNDINTIEDFVTGAGKSAPAVSQTLSLLDSFTDTAYADELSPEVEQAAVRRKDRYNELISLEKRGIVGENISGLVTLRGSGDSAVAKLVRDENNDRMVIYREIASKNGASLENVQKLYAGRLQSDASSGTPIETSSGNWQTK